MSDHPCRYGHKPERHSKGQGAAKLCPYGRRYIGVFNDTHTWETQQQAIDRVENSSQLKRIEALEAELSKLKAAQNGGSK